MSRLKIPSALADLARDDLRRPHPFAFERVGFLYARVGALPEGGCLLLAYEYHDVPDQAYVKDPYAGARISDQGFRPARQAALAGNVSVIHVHLHNHHGRPRASEIDLEESDHFMPDFLKIAPALPHAAIVLSTDAAVGRIWRSNRSPQALSSISFVGATVMKVQ